MLFFMLPYKFAVCSLVAGRVLAGMDTLGCFDDNLQKGGVHTPFICNNFIGENVNYSDMKINMQQERPIKSKEISVICVSFSVSLLLTREYIV